MMATMLLLSDDYNFNNKEERSELCGIPFRLELSTKVAFVKESVGLPGGSSELFLLYIGNIFKHKFTRSYFSNVIT